MAATVSDRENRSQVQTELLLGLQKEIEAMEPRLRPFSKALHIAREENPPACIAAQTAFRLPTQNSEAYVVGSDGDRRLVKIRDGEVVEERPYVEGFTLQGLLLSPREIRMAYDAIHKYHEAPTENPAITLRERMPWASEATLAAIAALPGPVVCCHLDATTANILVTTSGDSAILIDDEYQALAPAVLDFGIFVAKLQRKEGISLPETLLPEMPGVGLAAELAHQLWLESRGCK